MELPSTQGSEFYLSFTRAAEDRWKEFDLIVAAEHPGVIRFTDAAGASTTRTFTGGVATTIPLFSICSVSGSNGCSVSRENSGNNGFSDGSSLFGTVANVDGTTVITNHITGLTNSYTIAFNVPQNRGYIIETFEADGVTPQNVSIYAGMQGGGTAEYANIYPIDALGNEYFVLSRPGWNQSTSGGKYPNGLYPQDRLAVALVMATEDNTVIEIVPTSLLFGQGDTEDILGTIEITLNKGQTYQISPQALENNPGRDDITGTMIRTKKTPGNECKRIAVFSGTQHSRPGDWEYDQLFPVHLWGKEYLSVSPYTHDTRIVAAHPCTEVRINGSLVATLNASEFYAYNNGNAFIETSKPVGVAIFTAGNAGDGSMVVLAPVEQRLNSILFTVPSSGANRFILEITAPTDTRDDVQYANPISWSEVSGTNYSRGTTTFTPTQTAQITSAGGFNAYAYGDGGGLSYAFSVGSKAETELDLSIGGYSSSELAMWECPPLGGKQELVPSGLENYVYENVIWEVYENAQVTLDGDGKIDEIINFGNLLERIEAPYANGGIGEFNFINPDPTIYYALKMSVTLSGCFAPDGNIAIAFKIAEVTAEENTALTKCYGETLESAKAQDFLNTFNSGNEPNKGYAWYSENNYNVPFANTKTIDLASDPDHDYGTSKKYWVRLQHECRIFVDTIVVTVNTRAQKDSLHTFCHNLSNTNVLESSKATEANFNYAWYAYENDVKTPLTTGASLTITNDGTLDAKIYWVESESTINNCEAYADTFKISVDAPALNESLPKMLCPDNLLSSTISGADLYLWGKEGNAGFTGSQQNIQITENYSETGKYWVRAYHNCELTVDTFVVSVYDELWNNLIKSDFDGAICETGNQRVILAANEGGALTTPMIWEESTDKLAWKTFTANPLGEKPNITTHYRVVSQGECSQTVTSDVVTITVNPAFTVEISAPRAEYEPQQEIELTATQNSNIYSYTWYRNDEERYSDTPGQYRENMPQEEMAMVTFRLRIELIAGFQDELCAAESNAFVARVVKLPSFISPYTQDGIHDRFAADYDDVVVFNRLGQVVWDSKSQGDRKGWDGRGNNGKLVNPGVYYYVIQTKNDNTEGKPIRKTIEVVKK